MERSIPINRTKVAVLLSGTKGEIFSAAFSKKDGSYREMNARTGVVSHRKTKDKKSFAHKVNNPYFIVFDLQKGEYRVLNLETLYWVKYGGIKYIVNDGMKN